MHIYIIIALILILIYFCIALYFAFLEFVDKNGAFVRLVAFTIFIVPSIVPIYITAFKSSLFIILFIPIGIFIGALPRHEIHMLRIDDMTKDENIIGNYSSNIKNGGYICNQGDYVFMYGKSVPNGESLFAFKIDENGKEISTFGRLKTVLLFGQIKSINVIGDSIYFSKYKEDSGRYDAYEFNIQDYKEELLIENCDFINVIDDEMFYLSYVDTTSFLFKVDLYDLSVTTLSKEPCLDYLIEDDKIYFTNEKGVFLMNSDGKHFRKILDFVPSYYYVFEDYLYYSLFDSNKNESIIYKFIKKGSKEKIMTIKGEEIVEFAIRSDRITYLNKSKEVVSRLYDEADVRHDILKDIVHMYVFGEEKVIGWHGIL